MLTYVLTPDGVGIMSSRAPQIIKRKLGITIPFGAKAFVNGKVCKCDGETAWISTTLLQEKNTLTITLEKQSWRCEEFSYVDGMVVPVPFDAHERIAYLLRELETMRAKMETLSSFVEEKKQQENAPLFF